MGVFFKIISVRFGAFSAQIPLLKTATERRSSTDSQAAPWPGSGASGASVGQYGAFKEFELRGASGIGNRW